MKDKYDYYKQVKIPFILADKNCPKCNSELGAIHPDRVWCVNKKCNYGELHIIGEGTRRLNEKIYPVIHK